MSSFLNAVTGDGGEQHVVITKGRQDPLSVGHTKHYLY